MGECGVDHPYPFRRRVPVDPKMNFAISSSDDIRAEFLAYFQERKHTLVAPSSIYPRHTEGSYFINAGMNQFKSLFLRGTDQDRKSEDVFANLTRAANSQPCIRIGGRHDDLNHVGYDTYHHTMFEMLGNWSFGSYGREVACRQMWHFLTEVLRIPKSALYVTFFNGSRSLKLPADEEARQIWFDTGVSDRKLMAVIGESNFWQADEASGGLCGPCTEIHVDYSALNGKRDMTCARCLVNDNNHRVVELWNCVFITHRMVKGPNGQTMLQELPAMSVDAGLGLERLASVMQGTMTTYDTDVFYRLISNIQSEALRITGSAVPSYTSDFVFENELEEEFAKPRRTEPSPPPRKQTLWEQIIFGPPPLFPKAKPERIIDYDKLRRDIAYRIVADHSRALATAMRDGLLPGRQGVSLKLRHLIHRATRAAILTGLDSATRPELLKRIVLQIPLAAPFEAELKGPMARPSTPVHSNEQISEIIQQEVDNFLPRFDKMENAFLACMKEVDYKGVLSAEQLKALQSGQYGEPLSWDMICAQARWYGLNSPIDPSLPPTPVEKKSFFSLSGLRDFLFPSPITQDSHKYDVKRVKQEDQHSYEVPPLKANLLAAIEEKDSNINVVKDFDQLPRILSTQKGENKSRVGLIFDRTNFYSPCGGQASDIGVIRSAENQEVVFNVQSVEKLVKSNTTVSNDGWIIHWVSPSGSFVDIKPPISLVLCPDSERRTNLMRNHTAQHLLNWAFAEELASNTLGPTNHSSSFTVHYGGRIDPDKFSLCLTILQDSDKLESLVKNVEARCKAAIEAKLHIISEELNLSKVTEKPFVRRFPWETYPQKVRTVCIGGDVETISEKITGSTGFYSAELCGGTHVQQTEDLVDIVIIGLRARKQSVKEFIAISGESAVRARYYGSQQILCVSTELDSVKKTIKKGSHSFSDLITCAERLFTLQSAVDTILGGRPDVCLSHLDRCVVTRYQQRLSGLLGTIRTAARKASGVPDNVDPIMVGQLVQLIAESGSRGDDMSPIARPFNISNFSKFALSILHLAPKRPIVFYQKGLAVFYHPQSNEKAMKWAQMSIKRLNVEGANLATRVESFNRSNLGGGADHFAIVRLFSTKNRRQRDWKPYFAQLVSAISESP
nr:alanyl tRNA synthetase mitochondrial [Hymenolepis microstoma]